MITWHQIDPKEVVGRDVVIITPDGLVRGPIEVLRVSYGYVMFEFCWTAIQSPPGTPWRVCKHRTLGFMRDEPITLPAVDPDGRIRFHFNIDGFGDAAILPSGDNLDPYTVPGLESELDRSQGGEF